MQGATPKAHYQAFWLWVWAKEAKLTLSRDEAAEMLHTGAFTPEIRELWDRKSAQQKRVEALCSAAASSDEAALKVGPDSICCCPAACFHAHASARLLQQSSKHCLQAFAEAAGAETTSSHEQRAALRSTSSLCADSACLQAAIEAAGAETVSSGVADVEGRAPLHVAAVHGNLGALQALLDAGAPLDGLDGRNRTALLVRH